MADAQALPAVPPTAPEAPSRARDWVLKATGVLVVLPALVNGAHDVWVAVADLPKTEAQRQNERLYRDYFGQQPVQAIPVSVKAGAGTTIEARVSIWERGDVLVEYGGFTQWFPFPGPPSAPPRTKVGSFSLLPSAHAQAVPLKGRGAYTQSDSLEQGAIVRERAFSNGVVERSTLDPKTGEILNATAHAASAPVAAAQGKSVPEAAPIVVDLTRVAQAQAAPTKSTQLQAGLAWCKQKSNFFSRALCESRERGKYCGDAPDKPAACH